MTFSHNKGRRKAEHKSARLLRVYEQTPSEPRDTELGDRTTLPNLGCTSKPNGIHEKFARPTVRQRNQVLEPSTQVLEPSIRKWGGSNLLPLPVWRRSHHEPIAPKHLRVKSTYRRQLHQHQIMRPTSKWEVKARDVPRFCEKEFDSWPRKASLAEPPSAALQFFGMVSRASDERNSE